MTSSQDRPERLPSGPDRARLPLRVANPTPVQPVYRRLVRFAGRLLRLMVDRDWDDAANLPATGGVIVVSNHISYFDPPNLAHYLVWNGRWPRALGKADLWRVPVIGWLAKSTGQIPVERGTERAKDALVHAREALDQGECVVIYPEGTVTADPQTWPMTARPGAARLALASGAPVITSQRSTRRCPTLKVGATPALLDMGLAPSLTLPVTAAPSPNPLLHRDTFQAPSRCAKR